MNTHPNDRALINACLRHDEQALHELFVRFHRAVHAGATRAIAHRLAVCGTADDLTAEFFLQVVTHPVRILRRCSDRADLESWLTAVAFRRCSKILRSPEWRWLLSERIEQSRILESLAAPVQPRLHAADIVAEALSQLDTESRAIIEARFGLGPDEGPASVEYIAIRANCGRATIYRRLLVALRRLRRIVRVIEDKLEE